MGKPIKIHRGLNIPIKGEAEKRFKDISPDKLYALKPTDFHGVRPKLIAKPGDMVKIGSPVFYDKFHPEVQFCSPVSGVVKELIRGEKRKLLEIIIESDNKFDAIEIGALGNDAEAIRDSLLKFGYWPMIIQRPYGVIANPQDKPDFVFVSAFDSSPLAPDYQFILKDKKDEIKAGFDIISKLAEKPIHIGLKEGESHELFYSIENLNIHEFAGPHPVGNVGTQINKIRPINKSEIYWTINIQDVARIGAFFLNQKIDYSRCIAVTGSVLKETWYSNVLPGQMVTSLISDNLTEENLRVISGNVLTGKQISKSGYLSFYENQLSVIPEGDYYEFFGWLVPGFKKFSTSRSYLSWLMPKKKYKMDTNYHGGERAYVVTGEYEKVCPLDIYPQQLIKACMMQDIDKMEQLGIYEVIEEDMALCEFVCTSKTEVQSILRDSLDMLRKEMS
jgi:Na+-transporting NADH:ubiquinone oxidoreductase subunit A